jgi:formate dehydrogenase subunit delta
MDIDNLIRMANQIGAFYEAYPDPDAASREIASHLKRFWEPRMRNDLLEHVRAHGPAGLAPLVASAVAQLQQAHRLT